jgi:hypothetical protein
MVLPSWYAAESMAKNRVVEMKPAVSQATRDRDLVIRSVRDELLVFMGRKLATERAKDLRALGPDVACMVGALAEAMAVLHVDAIRSLAYGDVGSYERKVELARAAEQTKR